MVLAGLNEIRLVKLWSQSMPGTEKTLIIIIHVL